MPLIGVDEGVRLLREQIDNFDGQDTRLLVVRGPPGSGKTTAVEEALKELGYSVFRADGNESVTGEMSKLRAFCRAADSVDVLVSGRKSRRRAAFLDDITVDGKTIRITFDALKKAEARVLIIICIGRTAKAAEVVRRAVAVVSLAYPSKAQTTAHLAAKLGADPDLVEKCVRAARGCVPKAERMIEAEAYGTVAEESVTDGDSTIFETAERGFRLCSCGSGFADVEVCISNEPGMAALVLRDSVSAPSRGTREAFRFMSKTPGGSWVGGIASTVAFMETSLLEAHELQGASLKFPRCYTTCASRAARLKNT